MPIRICFRAVAITAAGIFLVAASARADYVYNYNSFLASGDYNTAANWSAGVVPVSSGGTDSVNMGVINGGFTAALVSDASASIPDMLSVGYSANQQLLGSNGTFNVTDPAALLNVGSAALATMGSASHSGPSGLYLGYDGIGAMSISNGTVNVIGNIGLGHDTTTAGCSPTGTLIQTGGLITTNAALISVVDGQYLAGDFNVGDGYTGSSGSYSLSGGSINIGRIANVGSYGGATGTITQTGGSASYGALRLNNNSTYTLSGNSILTAGVSTAGANIIGGPGDVTVDGTATFSQSGGSATYTYNLLVGDSKPGAYNITGGTTTCASACRTINIGSSNTGTAVGTLNISNGARFASTGTQANLLIAGLADGSGVTVTGNGSTFSVANAVTIGNYAWGYLTVTDHATANILKFRAGAPSGSAAGPCLLSVTNGGSLSVGGTSGTNCIGSNGQCIATVDGGTYTVTGTTTKTYVGFSDNSLRTGYGTLTIMGNGVFSGGAGMYIGNTSQYSGVVNVQDNATLTTPVLLIGGTNGTATFNQSGGTVTTSSDVTGTGTLNLSGGLMSMGSAYNVAVTTFNFSGGTLSNVSTVNTDVVIPTGGNAVFAQDATHPGQVNYLHVISGYGGLTKIGVGTLTLAKSNTYSGLTTVSAGTLQLGDGTHNGAVAGDIVDNAALTFNVAASTTPTYAGAISGTGSVTKLGGGALTLTGTDTYIGNTTVNGGALTINGSSLVKVSNASLSSQFLGTGALNLNGILGLDLSAVTENTDTWHVVDVTNLSESFGGGFGVGLYGGASFTQAGSVFSYVNASRTWTFSELTGDLTLATAITYLQGDADKNGTVNSTDLGLLLSHYNAVVTPQNAWAWGDFDGNGTVNSTDLGLLLSNYNKTSAATSAVPEPSTLLLAFAGLVGLLAYAWRKQK